MCVCECVCVYFIKKIFTTLKDHKSEFSSIPASRIINSTKTQMEISKIILQDICATQRIVQNNSVIRMIVLIGLRIIAKMIIAPL